MKISKVNAVYISPTGNVKKVTSAIAERAAKVLDVPLGSDDFTLPETRGSVRNYGSDELVIFGTPVYAGRVPNKFLPFVQELFKADGALAVPVVCFGNRNFDNALIAGAQRFSHHRRGRSSDRACIFRSTGSRQT